jgi:hypothetical protein
MLNRTWPPVSCTSRMTPSGSNGTTDPILAEPFKLAQGD